MTKRWYSPAYEANNGMVIPCGSETVVREHAVQSVRQLNDMWQDTPGSPEVFVAFVDRPYWRRLPVGGTQPSSGEDENARLRAELEHVTAQCVRLSDDNQDLREQLRLARPKARGW